MGVYQMRERMLAIGDDFWIENDSGERVFKVDGKALRIRQTLSFQDLDGNELLRIQERKLRVRDTMAIERDGEAVATVRKAIVSPLRERFKAELAAGGEYEVKGNIVDHEYEFKRDGREVATVSNAGSGCATPTAWRSRRRGRRARPRHRGRDRPDDPRQGRVTAGMPTRPTTHR